MPLAFLRLNSKLVMAYFMCVFGPAEMRGRDFEENKVFPSTFMQFWRSCNLNKLDWLTPQDV